MSRIAAALLALLLSQATLAQPPLGAEEPGVTDLALEWIRGEYRAPLICEIEGVPYQALRRVLVSPGPRHARLPMNRLALFDLEAPAGTRCHNETGAEQLNAIGSIALTLETRSRPDTARRDFEAALRRDGGFEFQIPTGRLRLGEPGKPIGELSEVDFSGGTARIHKVERGTDAFRRLAEYGDRRKLTLEIEAKDGTRLHLDLVQFGLR